MNVVIYLTGKTVYDSATYTCLGEMVLLPNKMHRGLAVFVFLAQPMFLISLSSSHLLTRVFEILILTAVRHNSVSFVPSHKIFIIIVISMVQKKMMETPSQFHPVLKRSIGYDTHRFIQFFRLQQQLASHLAGVVIYSIQLRGRFALFYSQVAVQYFPIYFKKKTVCNIPRCPSAEYSIQSPRASLLNCRQGRSWIVLTIGCFLTEPSLTCWFNAVPHGDLLCKKHTNACAFNVKI